MIGAAGLRALIKLKPTKLCERCNLRYLESEPACVHCKDLRSNFELEELKEQVKARQANGRKLGMLFFIIATILGVLLLLS